MDSTFAVDAVNVSRFPKGAEVEDVDRHGKPMKGLVLDVKIGNNVALVILQPRPAEPGNHVGE